jgi:hypothetical protein
MDEETKRRQGRAGMISGLAFVAAVMISIVLRAILGDLLKDTHRDISGTEPWLDVTVCGRKLRR